MPPEKDLKVMREFKIGEEDIQDPQASLERARLESSFAYGISLGGNLGYHSSEVVHSSTLDLHLWVP